jgi:hypothetical protein
VAASGTLWATTGWGSPLSASLPTSFSGVVASTDGDPLGDEDLPVLRLGAEPAANCVRCQLPCLRSDRHSRSGRTLIDVA